MREHQIELEAHVTARVENQVLAVASSPRSILKVERGTYYLRRELGIRA